MKVSRCVLKMQDTSYFGCIFLLSLFSFYCFKNIFLQAELKFRLPTVNLVLALNNADTFVDKPSVERFDLYANLAKTFEAYKDDYLEHYNNYLILLAPYLTLDDSQIALKYRAYKHYTTEEYKNHDSFMVRSPMIEFNQKFYAPAHSSEGQEVDSSAKFHHLFGMNDDIANCEAFVNNYIFPLYKSQTNSKEKEITTAMSSILNSWSLTRKLQLICFINSLMLTFIALICFCISILKPQLLFHHSIAYLFLTIFSTIYISMVILIFMCICTTMISFTSDMNLESLNSTSYNILQLLWLLTIGYFTFCWIIQFINKKNPNTLPHDDENDMMIQQLNDILKITSQSGDNEKTNGSKLLNGSFVGIKDIKVKPLVASIKRLVTPNEKHLPEKSDLNSFRDAEIGNDIFKDDNGVYGESINSINSDSILISEKEVNSAQESNTLGSQSFDTKHDDLKKKCPDIEAINIVSTSSLTKPDVSPYFKISNSSFVHSTSDSITSGHSTINKISLDSIGKDLINKGVGFYTHNGLQVNKDINEKSVTPIKLTEQIDSNPLGEILPFANGSSSPNGFDEQPIENASIQGERKSSVSGVSNEQLSTTDEEFTSEGPNSTFTENLKYNEIIIPNTSNTVLQKKKKNFEYFIPTTPQSDFTRGLSSAENNDGGDDNEDKSSKSETQHVTQTKTGEESVFSFDRMAENQASSL